jgi:hypothetical protein
MKIYVASSWRNPYYDDVRTELTVSQGAEVYDFKNDETAFSWGDVHSSLGPTVPIEFVQGATQHPLAKRGYDADMRALTLADVVVLVLPAGRSAHFEAGWGAAAGKPLLIYAPKGTPVEIELVYRAGLICTSLKDLLSIVEMIRQGKYEDSDEPGEQGRA